MKPHRMTVLIASLGCAVMGALAPAAGCNGTGVTPMCDYPDGANDPESGCGELVEAAAFDGLAVEEPAPVTDAPGDSPTDSPAGKPDASDATTPPTDASKPDAEDASDSHVADANHDAHAG
ncbi:MAG: hypothetical protein ACLQVI_22745 [Polyangiaceae bacterium]